MFEESLKSIRSYLYDRTASPLLGSYVVSWCVFNYKAFIILFSEATYLEKVGYIGRITEDPISYIMPAVFAAFYIFAFPWPSLWTFHYARWRQNELNKKKQKLDGERLLSVDRSLETIRESDEIKRIYEDEISKKNQVIEQLRKEISDLTHSSEPESDVTQNEKSIGNFTPIQLSILDAQSRNNGAYSDSNLVSRHSNDSIGVKHALTNLGNEGMIEIHTGASTGPEIHLTDKGIKWVIEKRELPHATFLTLIGDENKRKQFSNWAASRRGVKSVSMNTLQEGHNAYMIQYHNQFGFDNTDEDIQKEADELGLDTPAIKAGAFGTEDQLEEDFRFFIEQSQP